VLEFSVGGAVLAKAWSQYLADATSGALSTTIKVATITVDLAALLIVGVLTVVLALAITLSSRVNQMITAIKLAVVLLVIVVGIGYVKASNYTPYIPPAKPGGSSGELEQSLFSLLFGAEGSTYGLFGVLAAASVVAGDRPDRLLQLWGPQVAASAGGPGTCLSRCWLPIAARSPGG
jgi:APA family basic amino acid/polyamine antiporter